MASISSLLELGQETGQSVAGTTCTRYQGNDGKGRLAEDVVALYLRLNGYFLTGFVAHSPEPRQTRTEVDFLAVRFPFHSETEREVGNDPTLQVSSNRIDLLWCEVKSASRKRSIRFNDAQSDSTERTKAARRSILKRAGMFRDDCVIEELVEKIGPMLSQGCVGSLPCEIVNGTYQVRAVLFAPSISHQPPSNERFFVGGDAIFGFITSCLCPAAPREQCAADYGHRRWGYLDWLVRCIKKTSSIEAPVSMDALTESLGTNSLV